MTARHAGVELASKLKLTLVERKRHAGWTAGSEVEKPLFSELYFKSFFLDQRAKLFRGEKGKEAVCCGEHKKVPGYFLYGNRTGLVCNFCCSHVGGSLSLTLVSCYIGIS